MAWDLEGLIAGLLVLISCAGEQGCPVTELVDAIRQRLSGSPDNSQQPNRGVEATEDGDGASLRGISTVWSWLVQRQDVSIGPDRQYNHLSLEDVLARVLRKNPSDCGDSQTFLTQGRIGRPRNDPKRSESPPQGLALPEDIRAFTSEDTMWESITGHGVDHKRVPRSEWLCLLGIASTKTEGILQGNLGRLVDQDKRSVPKRTDSLFKKGYITKRTTLVRGTKTSKMWLAQFSPVLIRDGEDTDRPTTAGMDLSPAFLTVNLDPVPWHTRWTGESIDYIALATTILAIAKAWGVIRILDMKSKLGVLSMRWQMRVISKTCRFLNGRGTIQYVAARLDEKVFKDCIKFVRDMNAQDWTMYLATGKRGSAEVQVASDGSDHLNASPSLMATRPRWTPDEPIHQYVVRMAQNSNGLGVTNPDIYFLTLGPSFTRFISSLTSTMATATVQPRHLEHLQLRSEHTRSGKIASYRYFVQPRANSETSLESLRDLGSSSAVYGFLPLSAKPKGLDGTVSLSSICGQTTHRGPRGRPRVPRVETPEPSPRPHRVEHVQTPEAPQAEDNDEVRPSLPHQLIVNLMVPARTLRTAMESSLDLRDSAQAVPSSHGVDSESIAVDDSQHMGGSSAIQVVATPNETTGPPNPDVDEGNALDTENPSKSLQPDVTMGDQGVMEGDVASETLAMELAPPFGVGSDVTPLPRRGRGRPPGRGRGRGGAQMRGRGRGRGRGRERGRGGAGEVEDPESKPYKCEKCGGAWKNDVGLKYHLEKSQTPCNPSYDPSLASSKPSGKIRLEAALRSTIAELVIPDDEREESDVEQDGQRSEEGGEGRAVIDETPSLRRKRSRRETEASLTPLPKKVATGNYSQRISGPRRLQSRKLQDSEASSTLQTRQEVLLLGRKMETHKLSDLPQRGNRTSLPSATGEARIQTGSLVELDMNKTEGEEVNARAEASSQGINYSLLDPGLQLDRPALSDPIRPSPQGHESLGAPPPKTISRAERNQRVTALVKILLAEHNGVFPGGEALWRTLRVAWNKEYPSETCPTSHEFQTSLKWLIGKKEIADHWHAFRGRNGGFSKCQIITWPDVDAFSPEALEVMDKIRAAHPKLYIPERVLSAEGLGLQVDGDFVQGRRTLPSFVSVLDAPVYAAQIAAKRELETADDNVRERKRRTKGTRGQIKWVSDTSRPTAGGVSRFMGPLMGLSTGPGFHFLDPNTYMEEEEPPGYSAGELLQLGGAPAKRMDHYLQRERAGWGQDSGPLAVVVPQYCIQGSSIDGWPHPEPRFFEECGSSFTIQGWLPDSKWFAWAGIVQEIDRRAAAKVSRGWYRDPGHKAYRRFINRLRACVEVEMAWGEGFVRAHPGVAGPHNIFVQFLCRAIQDPREPGDLAWPHGGQLTLETAGYASDDSDVLDTWWSDDDIEIAVAPLLRGRRRGGSGKRGRRGKRTNESRKRVPLVRRRLTALPGGARSQADESGEMANQEEHIGDPDEVLAAIIAVRSLLGGLERSIDWGLLVQLFPDTSLDSLRRFWVTTRKSRSAYITKFSQDFRERFVRACEKDELPMINFDNPLDYDWASLIKWTMEIPSQEDVQIPQTLVGLGEEFVLQDVKSDDDDWREKFFHYQASTYGRLDVATAEPGAAVVDSIKSSTLPDNVDVARSWIRSLCCTSETKYAPGDVKEALLRLVEGDPERVSSLLQKALSQLTQHKIIHKSPRPAFGGRPYRLTEWYTSTLSRLSQCTKYQEAATFKMQLDEAYRRGEPFEIPYAATDGTMMALINMNARGRIQLMPQDVPYIPFGFKPGNYESRKFPKSYYHFGLVAVPTETYQYNEHIETLKAVAREAPPSQGPRHALPQWVDFFGQYDIGRWCEVLGAVCFAYSTRGQMQAEALCSALRPVLESFEAQMILDWGQKTGVLEQLPSAQGFTVGEWWWLAVPWQQECLHH